MRRVERYREQARDSDDARRFIYRLTEKGIALAPALVELVLRAATHETAEAPPGVLKAMRADRAGFLAQVHAGWQSTRPKQRSTRKPG